MQKNTEEIKQKINKQQLAEVNKKIFQKYQKDYKELYELGNFKDLENLKKERGEYNNLFKSLDYEYENKYNDDGRTMKEVQQSILKKKENLENLFTPILTKEEMYINTILREFYRFYYLEDNKKIYLPPFTYDKQIKNLKKNDTLPDILKKQIKPFFISIEKFKNFQFPELLKSSFGIKKYISQGFTELNENDDYIDINLLEKECGEYIDNLIPNLSKENIEKNAKTLIKEIKNLKNIIIKKLNVDNVIA